MSKRFSLSSKANNKAERSSSKNLLYYQEIIRHGKKEHVCTFPDCNKTFRFKSEFMRHRVIHAMDRPFDCPFADCNKTFKREDALKNHVRLHTGEMPYKCDKSGCDMGFPTKAALRYHELKHSGEKLNKCSFPGCGKSFLTATQLKQHETGTNYHKKVIRHKIEPCEEVQHVTVAMEKPVELVERSKDGFCGEFFAPELKPIENIHWEIKDQYGEVNEVPRDLQESFEKMVKVILKDNNAMKQRLGMCSTLMHLMQDNYELKQKVGVPPMYEQTTPETSDEQPYSFLDFFEDDRRELFGKETF